MKAQHRNGIDKGGLVGAGHLTRPPSWLDTGLILCTLATDVMAHIFEIKEIAQAIST